MTGTPRMTVEKITPEQAAKYLEGSNENSRLMRKRRIEVYADQMLRGLWRYTGDAVKLDNDGNVLDGFHRLHACIDAGVPFRTLVIRGIDPEAVAVMDTGLPRSAGDLLRTRDIINANAVAGIARLLMRWRGDMLTGTHKSHLLTHEDIGKFVDEHEKALQVAARTGDRIRKALSLSLRAGGTFAFEADDSSGVLAEPFIEGLITGVGLEVGHPALAFRTWQMQNLATGRRRPAEDTIRALAKCWNAWAMNDSIKLLRLPTTDPIPHLVPRID